MNSLVPPKSAVRKKTGASNGTNVIEDDTRPNQHFLTSDGSQVHAEEQGITFTHSSTIVPSALNDGGSGGAQDDLTVPATSVRTADKRRQGISDETDDTVKDDAHAKVQGYSTDPNHSADTSHGSIAHAATGLVSTISNGLLKGPVLVDLKPVDL